MSKIKQFAVPTIVLFIICFVAAALLGLTNEVTSPIIAENDLAAAQDAMKAVLPDAATFGKEGTNDYGTYAPALDADGNIIGYAITSIGKGGYDGDIKVMVGVTENGVNGTAVLSNNETASVGGKKVIKNETFMNQFLGLTENASIGNGNVDAISGATKTSTGVADAVNNALLCYAQAAEEVSANG